MEPFTKVLMIFILGTAKDDNVVEENSDTFAVFDDVRHQLKKF